MEQQKVLWVVFSVMLLLVIAVVSVIIIFKPEPDDTVVTFTANDFAGVQFEDPRDLVINPENVTQTLPLPIQESGPADTVEYTATFPQGSVTIKPEDNSTAKEPVITAPAVTTQKSTGAQTVPSSARAAASTVSQPKPAAAASAVRENPAPRPRPSGDYWIQLGSYSSKTNAENRQEELGVKNIAASIIVAEVNDRTFYRLWNGPYGNLDEANKFLEWFRQIPGTEDALVYKN